MAHNPTFPHIHLFSLRLIILLIFVCTILPTHVVGQLEMKTPVLKPLTPDPIIKHESDISGSICPNSDFSLGSFKNWEGCFGTYYFPCASPGFNSPPPARHTIMDPGSFDPHTTCESAGLPTVFPGDLHSCRLGNDNTGGQAEQMSYTVYVDNSNSLFIYRYAVVLQNNPQHTENIQSKFNIDLYDASTNLPLQPLECTSYYVFANESVLADPTWHACDAASGTPIYWREWQTVGMDLSPYLHSSVKIVFTTHDCQPGGHFGYAYISAFCSSMNIELAGCEGTGTVTLSAPPGFATYEWSGPYCADPLQCNCPSPDPCPTPPPTYSGQTVTLNASQGAVTGNQFALNLTALNGCVVPHVMSTISFTSVTAGINSVINCVGNSSSFFDISTSTNAAQPIIERTWDFGDGTPPVVHTTLNPVTHTYTSANTYTVTLTSYSKDACEGTTTQTISVGLPPEFNNLAPGKTICSGDVVALNLELSQLGAAAIWTNTVNPAGSATIVPDPPSKTGILINDQINNPGPGDVTVTYEITPRIGNCAGTPVLYAVLVHPLPTATITGTVEVCLNATEPTITLTGANATAPYTFTYNINGGAPLTVTTTVGNTITVAVPTTAAGVFTYNLVSVSDATATVCSQNQSGSAVVTVNPLPVPVVTSGPTSVCLNISNRYITEPAMTNYLWNIPDGTGTITPVAGPGNEIDVVWHVIGPHDLTVNYTDTKGCTAPTPTIYQVNVQLLPDPTIVNGANAVCAGQTFTYTTQSGASSYAWSYPATGVTKISGGSVNENFLELRWDNAGGYDISINYSIGIGCTAPAPTIFHVTVNANPTPVITGPLTPICGFSTQTYSTPGTGHVYQWTANGGTVTTGVGTSTISILWGNTPPVSVDLTEIIIYPGGSCSTVAANFPVSFKPWPLAPGIIAGPVSVCKTSTHAYSVPPIPFALSYLWNYSGSGCAITGNGSATISIAFSGTATSGNLTVTGNNDCGDGPVSAPLAIAVNPLPVVNFALCADPITTLNAKRFILKGGTPLLKGLPAQEGYSTVNGVSGNNPIELAGGIYYFNPKLLAPSDAGLYPISYRYTNQFGCEASATSGSIDVLPSNAGFVCGTQLIDPRQPAINYKTTFINGQCWLQENLRYGGTLGFANPQTDNCIFNRYCLATDDVNCSLYGGLYQWDELMQYDGADKAQGFCPPGWHVPNEAEWDGLIQFVSANIGNGVAGSFLTDLTATTSFKAKPSGFFYLNKMESFSSGVIKGSLFWTSTSDPLTKKTVVRGVNDKDPSVSWYQASKSDAFPVRCVKD